MCQLKDFGNNNSAELSVIFEICEVSVKKKENGSVNEKNNSTVELLSEMYRNVTMGSENLLSVIPMIKDKFLLSNVTNQLEEYAAYTRETEKQLKKHSVDPKEPTLMKKLMSRGGIAVNTMFDSSDSHIAEMIEKGTRMGMESLVKKHDELSESGCDNDSLRLCGDIEDFERREVKRIGEYIV